MSAPNPGPAGHAFTLVDCFSFLGIVGGAAYGAYWGYARYGVLGAVAGVPVGAVAGFLAVLLLVVVLAATVVAVLALTALVTGGPREFREFLRRGPKGLREEEEAPESHREAGGPS